MVALIGAHTIGMSHCDQFAHRLFGFGKTLKIDPAYNPEYAAWLRKLYENYKKESTMVAYNDMITPVKFNNMYFKNSWRELGLLAIDSALFTDPQTKPFIETYTYDEGKFFQDFSHAIEKLRVLDVKTGKEGEVQSRCDFFNALN
ncbi:peroxidase 65-like [Vigna radiata var. radiata]|uniref:peroxidase n=1 Tax=Vigna radiata var. radiata TaxID=3916 RepID=A0A3Q0EJ06_VIGRR|nr:peroxidase 65-like [Vigna radiata var. radiata]